jgi:hypothetical protein
VPAVSDAHSSFTVHQTLPHHRTLHSVWPASDAIASDAPMTTSSARASVVKPPDTDVNVRRCRSQRPTSVSQRDTVPRLCLRFWHPVQRKISVLFPRKRRIPPRNPKPLSTPQTPPTLQMCQYQQVFTTLCACVSIFSNIF